MIVLLDKKKNDLLINIAKNTQTFLTQCNETITEDDIGFLNLDLLDEFISDKNKTFVLEIDDKILNALSEKFPYIRKERLRNYIEDAAKKFSEDPMNSVKDGKEKYISDIKYCFLDFINKGRYFQPKIYKDIIANNNIMLSDSFFQLHYFQCIFFACMIHCLNLPPQARKAIIIKIIDLREIFQKMPEEFAKTEFALLAKNKKISNPEQILDFIIKFICQDFVNQNDYGEIKTIIKNLYDFLYSEEARKNVVGFHVTQSNLLRPQKQLLSLGSVFLVDFKTAYKIVVGEELDLSPELEEIYQNWPDEVKTYEYDRTFVNVSADELNQWELKKIINYINYFSRDQLWLRNRKISDCILYIRNPDNNYSGELKQKKITKFIELIPEVINYLTLEEIIEWHQFINFNAFAMLDTEKIIELINYFKNNDDLPGNFVKKLFYLFHMKSASIIERYNVNTCRNILNHNFFEKMIIYKDYIDFSFINNKIYYHDNRVWLIPFFEFICINFERNDVKLLVKKISNQEEFCRYLIENKNDVNKEIIYENSPNIKYKFLNNLHQKEFEYLLDIFIEKKHANFEILKKMFFIFLSRKFFNENLMLKKCLILL